MGEGGPRQDAPPRKGYWRLVGGGEPFRLMFPMAVAAGMVGASLWPLFVFGVIPVYPGIAHARIMVEGFLGSFVIGFLGTALPRLIEAPELTLAEALAFAAALVALVAFHTGGWTLWGDATFFCLILCLMLAMFARSLLRKDLPPPGFVLVIFGLLCALTGSGILAATQVTLRLPGWLPQLGRLFLNQGFILLPVMGVGAFLLPRFFGLPSRHDFDSTPGVPPGWMRTAVFSAICGLGILASFVLEAVGLVSAGCGLRAAVLAIYFFIEVPMHRAGWGGGGSLALALRFALLCLPLGYLLLALMPSHAFSFLHVVFIGGFSILTLTVAGRVVLGHCGQSEKFERTLWSVLAMTGLVALAMLTRVSADWMPALALKHYAYAAITWVLGLLIWALGILPGVRRDGSE